MDGQAIRYHQAGYLLDQAAIGQAYLRMGHRRERAMRRLYERPLESCVLEAARSPE